MKVPLLDLRGQYAAVRNEVRAAIDEVLDSQHFIMGPQVSRFEEAIATYCGVPHAVGVASGSDALLLTLMALGIGSGDAVITTAYSFFASVSCITRVGARPLIADIAPETFNLDPAQVRRLLAEECERRDGVWFHRPTGTRLRALIAVHLFGQCADMEALRALCDEHGLALIEDAAQAIGATRHGQRTGGLGDIACFSFFPSKNLGAYGDAGMVTTADPALAERVRLLRVHGSAKKYHHEVVGLNSRLDALQAAILRAKLPHLDSWAAARRERAAAYDRLLADIPGVVRPATAAGNVHVFHQYVIRVPRRDALAEHLRSHDIETAIYYPIPLHRLECFLNLGYAEGTMPVSERAAGECLALPMFPELTAAQQECVATTIAAFLAAPVERAKAGTR